MTFKDGMILFGLYLSFLLFVTDLDTDIWTDKAAYRDARTHLKTRMIRIIQFHQTQIDTRLEVKSIAFAGGLLVC